MNMPLQSGTPLLEISGLRCRRGGRRIFSSLQLSLSPGSVRELRGPNGSGKTTLLRIAAGLFQDFRGRVRCSQNMLYIGHHAGLKETLSPRQNLLYFCVLHGADRHRIPDCLGECGLAGLEDIPCVQLSAGQQQRVVLARLMLSPARLWLLDEPFAALDVRASALLQRLLADHAHRGGAALLSVHRPQTDSCETLQIVPFLFHCTPPAAQMHHTAAKPPPPSLGRCFRVFLHRDLQLLLQSRSARLQPVLFFFAIVMLFAISRGMQNSFPQIMAPGVLWTAALLACILAGDELCRGDFEDGSLDFLLTASAPLWLFALARIFAAWIGTILPLVLFAPLAGILLSLPILVPLWLSLAVGGGALAALGVCAAALTVATRSNSLLAGQIFVPLALPVLIFGVAVSEFALGGFAWLPALSFLGAFSLGAFLLLPAAIAEGWRIAAGQ